MPQLKKINLSYPLSVEEILKLPMELENNFLKKVQFDEIQLEILEKLEKIKRGRVVHPPNRNLNFVLNKPDGTYFSVRMKSKENIVLIEENTKAPRVSNFSKCKVSGTDNNGTVVTLEENFDTLKEVYEEMCARYGIAPIQDLSRVFNYDGVTFDQKLIDLGI